MFLDRRPIIDNPISHLRIKHIALSGLLISTAGLLVLPIYQLTSNVEMTVRLVTVFAIVVSVIRARSDLRPGPAWPDERRRMFNVGMAALTLALWVANLAVGSATFMMLLFCCLDCFTDWNFRQCNPKSPDRRSSTAGR
ncbi:MAG TPA: hypothetical protein VIW94_00800 [Acidimicrobiia bacterium]